MGNTLAVAKRESWLRSQFDKGYHLLGLLFALKDGTNKIKIELDSMQEFHKNALGSVPILIL